MISLSSFSALQGRRLHLGVCGSVAAYKAIEVMRQLQKAGVEVGVTLTEAATRFVTPLTFASLGADPVYTSMFGQDEGPLFGHLQPGRTAHAMLVAPATATTMARMAAGLADDMLAAQALAFCGPVTLAPAMNPTMWKNPATQYNVARLAQRGIQFVSPENGTVACGDVGEGKLASVEEIVFAAARSVLPQDMAGSTVLVTLGPTREAWDDVRVWTNLSTGKMGAALATAAWLRGAAVHAVTGPGTPELPAGIVRHNVSSAWEMFETSKQLWPGVTHGVFTAAVADFRPTPYGNGKFKKRDGTGGLTIAFQPNPDILATLAMSGGDQKILGFAAETEKLEESARTKLAAKKAGMIAGNLVGSAGSGFASATNTMFVCDRNGREEHWPSLAKEDVAWRLLDWLLTL